MTAEGESRLFVRRSLARAQHESGGDDSPHSVESFPRMAAFAEEIGCKPAMQFGELPHSFATRFASKVGVTEDCTQIVHSQREVKSSWELEMMAEGAEIQMAMFETVSAVGGEGVPEIELVAAAEAVSRAAGFGGNVQMRRFPLQCDRGVIVSGRAGGFLPSSTLQLGVQGRIQWHLWVVGLPKSKQMSQFLSTSFICIEDTLSI